MPDPKITQVKPLFEALGYQRLPSGTFRYFLRIGDEVRKFRALEMHGLAFLMEVYPYAGYWAAQFPRQNRAQIDTKAALAWFIRACREAGEYGITGGG